MEAHNHNKMMMMMKRSHTLSCCGPALKRTLASCLKWIFHKIVLLQSYDDDDDNDDDDDYRHPDHHALMMNVKMMMTMTIKQKRKAKKHESIRDPLKYQMVFIK